MLMLKEAFISHFVLDVRALSVFSGVFLYGTIHKGDRELEFTKCSSVHFMCCERSSLKSRLSSIPDV